MRPLGKGEGRIFKHTSSQIYGSVFVIVVTYYGCLGSGPRQIQPSACGCGVWVCGGATCSYSFAFCRDWWHLCSTSQPLQVVALPVNPAGSWGPRRLRNRWSRIAMSQPYAHIGDRLRYAVECDRLVWCFVRSPCMVVLTCCVAGWQHTPPGQERSG